jgi:hypothetical protein
MLPTLLDPVMPEFYLASTVIIISNRRARKYKRLRRPGIDSEDWIPPAYVAWRAGTTNRVVVPARQARNRFLGSPKRFNTGSGQRISKILSQNLWDK